MSSLCAYQRLGSKYFDGFWRELANAIILQAVDDYKTALEGVYHPENSESAEFFKQEITELMSFFRSEWFSILTDVDPDVIIKYVNDEVMKGEDLV